jgi:hypothetical protein
MRDLMKNIPPSTLSPIQRKIVITFTSSLGLGLSPFAPGTFGTLPALPLCWALSSLNKWGAGLLGYLAIGAVLYFLGVWASFAAERLKRCGRDDLIFQGFRVLRTHHPWLRGCRPVFNGTKDGAISAYIKKMI